MGRSAKPDNTAFFASNGKFLHNVMGDFLLRENHIGTINGVLSIYQDGIYQSGDAPFFREMIRLCPTLTDSRRREVLRYLRYSPDTPELQLAPPNFIPFHSKIYDVQTEKFLNFSPDMVFTCRFPYDYRPDTPRAELIDHFLKSVSCGNGDVIKLICEATGYCLYRINIHRIAVLLLGGGSNGKSTLLNLLSQFVGQENCANLSLQDMEQRFRIAELYGKAANICDDCGSGFIQDSSILKRVVTGGQLVGERKGQDPFTFRPFAKNFLALNELPSIADRSNGLYSRLVILPLEADFSADPDLRLKDRHWTEAEMQYFTRIAVKGLKSLLNRGDFTRPECVDAALREYRIANNPALQFILQAGEDLNGQATSEAYQNYRFWTAENGYKPLSAYQFSREVCRHGFETKNLYKSCLGKGERSFVKISDS